MVDTDEMDGSDMGDKIDISSSKRAFDRLSSKSSIIGIHKKTWSLYQTLKNDYKKMWVQGVKYRKIKNFVQPTLSLDKGKIFLRGLDKKDGGKDFKSYTSMPDLKNKNNSSVVRLKSIGIENIKIEGDSQEDIYGRDMIISRAKFTKWTKDENDKDKYFPSIQESWYVLSFKLQ